MKQMIRNRYKTILILAFSILFLLSLCGCKKEYKSDYDGMLGSAGEITDDTVIVSIFADDRNYSWTDSAEDTAAKEDCLEKLSEATSYLETEIDKYIDDGTEGPTFYYDWSQDEELYYATEMDISFTKNVPFKTIRKYIKENIDSEALKKKYEADNIIYFVFSNSDETNDVTSRTLSWGSTIGSLSEYMQEPYLPETTLLFYAGTFGGRFYVTSSQSYAHEIMHDFGAEDLYRTTDKINKEYVNYCFARSAERDWILTHAFAKTAARQ